LCELPAVGLGLHRALAFCRPRRLWNTAHGAFRNEIVEWPSRE